MPLENQQFIDIAAPEHGVQVTVREDGKVMWVSVDGLTVLRVSRIPYLEFNHQDQLITLGQLPSGEES